MKQPLVEYDDFVKVDLRIGTVLEAKPFDKAKIPAYQLKVDLGALGIKKSSAQITELYKPEDLIGKQVIAVVNFPPKQIADFMSEILILGIKDKKEVVLLHPQKPAKNGNKAS